MDLKPQFLSENDFKLSMDISQRARRPEDNEGLRSLIVHRFTGTLKAVARLGLGTGKLSIFCEPCRHWTFMKDDVFPNRWQCPRCDREYAIEFAVMEELEELEEDEEDEDS